MSFAKAKMFKKSMTVRQRGASVDVQRVQKARTQKFADTLSTNSDVETQDFRAYEQESLRSPIKPSQAQSRISLYEGIPLSKFYKQRSGRYDYNLPADNEPESDDDQERKNFNRARLEIELKSREAVMRRIIDNN